jgi:hypothetical protein
LSVENLTRYKLEPKHGKDKAFKRSLKKSKGSSFTSFTLS